MPQRSFIVVAALALVGWSAARFARSHAGQDVFAPRGTPVRSGTPPHLHLGVYVGTDDDPCAWNAIDRLRLLVDRDGLNTPPTARSGSSGRPART